MSRAAGERGREKEDAALLAKGASATPRLEIRRGARSIDVAAIENVDRRCIELLREDAADTKHGVSIPAGAIRHIGTARRPT